MYYFMIHYLDENKDEQFYKSHLFKRLDEVLKFLHSGLWNFKKNNKILSFEITKKIDNNHFEILFDFFIEDFE